MRPYSTYTDKELSGILSKYSMLSLIAKKELMQEFSFRDIEVDKDISTAITKEIELEHQKISDLEYVNNLGLQIEQNNDGSYQVQRSSLGKMWDFGAIVIGVLMLSIGIVGVGNLSTVFSEKLNIFSLITGIAMIVIGVYGFNMIFSGAGRLLEYASFHLYINKDTFYVKKPWGLKSGLIEGATSELYIKSFENHQSLMYKDQEIIKVNAPNIFNSKTLHEILQRSQQSITTHIS